MSENTKNLNLKEISQKVHQTKYIDGFAFIFIGLVLMIAAGVINFNFSFGLIILVIVSEALRPKVAEILRNHFTYPRLGYYKVKAEEARKEFPRVIVFMTCIIMASVLVILIIEGGNIDDLYRNIWRYGPVIFGLIMFGPSIDLVQTTGQDRYYGLGIFSTLLGLLVFALDFPTPKYGFVVYLTILGFISVLIGSIMFFLFITTYPHILDNKEPVNEELV